jgi:hypothetical protein
MKLFLLSFMLLVSLSAWAQSRTCEMTSGGNATQLKLLVAPSGMLVQVSEEEEPDQCVVEASNDFDLLVRCGSGEDATFFGLRGSSGRVYGSAGTIAQLRKCKRI